MFENLSDKKLLETADEHAGFRILYNRYWEGLYKKAFFRFGNNADAEDAVQEVFISFWRNRETIEVEETLAPYLFTVYFRCYSRGIQSRKTLYDIISNSSVSFK